MLAVGIYQQDDTTGYNIAACTLTTDVEYTVLAVRELKTNLLSGYDWEFEDDYAQNYEHGDTTNTLVHYTGEDEWGTDQCVNWGGGVYDTSDFTGTSGCADMQEPVFLNSVPYVVCTNAAGTYSSVWKLSSGGAKTKVHDVTDTILDIASFENHGFIYTLDGEPGYYILQLNYDDFDTFESVTVYEDTENWRIFQDKDEQHVHRPVWGVKESAPTDIYRLTHHAILKMDHDNASTTIAKIDLYDRNYDLYPQRYHATVVMPG